VFFIDDRQSGRPSEIGSSRLIQEAAASIDARYDEQTLIAQFRCAGSDEFIDWADQLLGLRDTDVVQFDPGASDFELKVFDTPGILEAAVAEKDRAGYSARMTAGFCWPWSDPRGGELVADVVIGEFRRPWNAKPDARGIPKTVPKSHYWATDPRGITQVGCVYTAQGFEFDYVGVIWGEDLVVRNGEWQGVKTASRDSSVKRAPPERFAELVKNTYRVLLTRGLKGCFLYFTDDETRAFVERRLVP